MDEERKQRIKDILEALNIHFSEEQSEIFWDGARNLVMAGGEGSGKSYLGGLWALCMGLTDPRTKLVWIIGADMEDARKEMDYLIEFAAELGALDRKGSTISTHTDQRCRAHVYVPATLQSPAIDFYAETVSGYDPLKIGREEPDYLIGCEVSRWSIEVWQRSQGRLARKYPRSRGFFSGSFETSSGWFPEVFNMGQGPNTLDVKSFSVPSHANPVLYPGGASDPAILMLQDSMSPERFLSRHMGKPSPPRDAVLPEFKTTLHVWPVAHTPGYPTYVFIDPGTTVYAVLFVQIVGEEVHVLNEVYMPQATHESVMQATMTRAEWKYVQAGVIDVAANQHHGGFASPLEAWHRDTGLRLRTQYVRLDQTLERLRSVLAINPVTQRPRLLVHPHCRGLIAEMGGGHSPNPHGGLWRMGSTGNPMAKNDHASKALAYGLTSFFGTVRPRMNDKGDDYEDDVATYLSAPNPMAGILADLTRRGRYGTA